MCETKVGKIVKVIYNNSTNGFTVALFETNEEQFTLTGNFHVVNLSMQYRITGAFHTHPRYGEQFQVSEYEELIPKDENGIQRFLSSGTIKGIGRKMAKQIVDAFGKDTFQIFEEEPERLLNIKGIGEKTLKCIVKSYKESREFMKISLELGKLGIETAQAIKVYKLYGEKTLEVIRKNPYTLVEELYGMTFRKADTIARNIGIENESPFRIQSGLKYVIKVHEGKGSTYVPRNFLIEEATELLEVNYELIEENLIQIAFSGEIQTDSLDGVPVVYPYSCFQAEQSLSWNLRRIKDAKLEVITAEIENLIIATEKKEHIILSKEQKEAVKAGLKNPITIITGGPGTGKTTIINIIVKIFEQCGLKTGIGAPTGRAAKRITETSGLKAKTIHRLLDYVYTEDEEIMEFGYNADNPLEEKVIIIDEASMVDLFLMDALVQAISDGSRLIIVGDADQLPAVGVGNVLRDMIQSEYIPTIRLQEIFRQAKESRIIINAHCINRGEYPEHNGKNSDFFFMHRDSEEKIIKTIQELCGGRLKNYYDFVEEGKNIQIITPTRKGKLGTVNLNKVLQEVLNPTSPDLKEKSFHGNVFREKDKVMQIRNNYQLEWKQAGTKGGRGIFNGDMGEIVSIDNENEKIIVNFDGRFVTYDNENLNELILSYAITVHKSQGCEFPVVIIPMSWFPPMLMTKNLLYTGITRGKQLVIIVGSEERMRQMIDNDRSDERYTGLKMRLKEQDFGVF